jgi:hypothetical protein
MCLSLNHNHNCRKQTIALIENWRSLSRRRVQWGSYGNKRAGGADSDFSVGSRCGDKVSVRSGRCCRLNLDGGGQRSPGTNRNMPKRWLIDPRHPHLENREMWVTRKATPP